MWRKTAYIVGVLLLLASYGAYRREEPPAFFKIKPSPLPAQDAGIPKIAIGVETITVQGPEWASFVQRVSDAVKTKKLPRGWEHRRSPGTWESYSFESLFFLTSEPPLSEIAARIPVQKEVCLRLDDHGNTLFMEVLRGSPSDLTGYETGHTDLQVRWNLPTAFRYPYRSHATSVALAGILLLVLPFAARLLGFLGAPQANRTRNTQKRAAGIWMAFTGLALLTACLPAFLEMDMMKHGFALVFLSGFAAIAGIIGSVMFIRRAVILDALLSGRGLLVHWRYSPQEWKAWIDAEFKTEKGEKGGLFFILLSIVVVVGVGTLLISPDKRAAVIVCLVLFAVTAVCGILAYWGPRHSRRRYTTAEPETYLGSSAVFCGGALHCWDTFGGKLEGVKIDRGAVPAIDLEYSMPARNSRQYQGVRIPIPAGREEEAETVVRKIIEANTK